MGVTSLRSLRWGLMLRLGGVAARGCGVVAPTGRVGVVGSVWNWSGI